MPQLSVPRVIRLSLSPSLSPLSPARKLHGSEKPKPKPKPKVLRQVSKIVRKSKSFTTIVLGRAGRVTQSNQQDALPLRSCKRRSCQACAATSVRQHPLPSTCTSLSRRPPTVVAQFWCVFRTIGKVRTIAKDSPSDGPIASGVLRQRLCRSYGGDLCICRIPLTHTGYYS